MIKYHKHIGIDIGKYNFVVGIEGIKDTKEYENTSSGIFEFINDNKDILANSLTVVETTGGYELELLYSLCERGYVVHRADARKVKNFIRSYGNSAKTDKLDAKALGLYGKE
ncbi:transposase family protein [Rickettsia bellii str. RML Mogi]|uniref:Transposase family protein n=4 Tax=Rickettsia bellii TaxID=33990 RepID=A0A0F3QJX3_RICBE|nr:transposase [Rickettsia bellii]KJV92451.1 transposase family protein [Rickettsia bellii str. RML Mogi]